MRIFLLCLISAVAFSTSVTAADDGLISVLSHHDVKTTTDRLVKALDAKGMTIFARINHSGNAQKVGKELRPTELVIFGNPKIGTPLMQCGQSMAIDLPQKALIWEDKAAKVWFSYNDPSYIAQRHNLTKCDDVIKKVQSALGNFAQVSTKP